MSITTQLRRGHDHDVAEQAHPLVRLAPPFSLWWPLAVFALTRLFTFGAILELSHNQVALPNDTMNGYFVDRPTLKDPGYLSIITNWDGQWYQKIATSGYQIPTMGRVESHDQIWAWAFPPGFPFTTRALMEVSGLGFQAAATLLNLGVGAAAVLLLFKLLERSGGRALAASGVALTCCFVTAPLLQAAYSESLALLLLVATLYALQRRRYSLGVPTIAALSVTRIITAPLAIVVALHAVERMRREGARTVGVKNWLMLAVLGAESVAGVWTWSIIARVIAGSETGASDRVRSATLHPAFGWFGGLWRMFGWPGLLTVCLFVTILILLAAHPGISGNLGTEVRVWFWSYPLYILAVTPVTTGVLRYMLLAFPLPLIVYGNPNSASERRRRLCLVGVACAAGLTLQVLWLSHSLVVTSANHVTVMP